MTTTPPPGPHLLAGYEVRYDQHYIGFGLHCLRCANTDEYHDIDWWGGSEHPTLAHLVQLAVEHEINHYQEDARGHTETTTSGTGTTPGSG